MNRIVAAIISNVDSSGVVSYFLVRSKKDFGSFTDHWYPPGGKVEEGETDVAALRREIGEELGVEMKSERFVTETPGDVPGSVVLWYMCDISSENITLATNELAEGIFFTREAIKKLPFWPATRTFFEAHIL